MVPVRSILFIIYLGPLLKSFGHEFKQREQRSIDLSTSHKIIPDDQLSKDVIPRSYEIHLRPNLYENSFSGSIKMNLSWNEDTKKISLHAHYDLNIDKNSIKLCNTSIVNAQSNDHPRYVLIQRADRLPKKTVYVIYLKEVIKQGTECELFLKFDGYIWENSEGLFKGSYNEVENGETIIYLATYMRPQNARRLFPCFDEPGFKVPYTISISRPSNYVTLFNTPLERSEPIDIGPDDYVVDYFETTPPMSSFTFGFVISQLKKLNPQEGSKGCDFPKLNLWATNESKTELRAVYPKLCTIYKYLASYFNTSLPLSKIDVLAIPGLATVRPADNWGLLMFKEKDLLKKGYYGLTQELIYQWLGSWVTPYLWSDAHINKALASFLAANIAIKIDKGNEFNGKYPMTQLYSLYYEFSKRYPHSRITGMKQETTSFKTELIMRMLNFTLGSQIFMAGIRKFISDRHFGTFLGDDLWDSLTDQALLDNAISPKYHISEIAASWITKDRLPVIKITRDYNNRKALVQQKVYLRERPHDVPEQDRMLWWIPLVLIRENKLDFSNSTPYSWVEKCHRIVLVDLPEEDKFIIVNPEEIGPFPVNYDEQNWNLLSDYLQTHSGRKVIPILTRAKLLHDAWNLAYAGDLSFATAFNMTLFMRYERNHIVWNPVFTFIDHIGRHIDISEVHKKFEKYVRVLLTPLYDELGQQKAEEDSWKTDLRSLAKKFLCRAGYRPCIEEAQEAFRLWMQGAIPDRENPVPSQYLCPVFKWGTMREWEFGLHRVINFPKSRLQSERTYLLKTLAGCPEQTEKIVRLLNFTIIQGYGNFTETDVFLIFNMLTGGSNRYMSLLNFLSENWSTIKKKFQSKTNLWDSLIGSATGAFTTMQGFEMVRKLHEDHRGEFGSAEHIIEKSLKNIKEEAIWSEENLPIIDKWLDSFLSTISPNENKFFET